MKAKVSFDVVLGWVHTGYLGNKTRYIKIKFYHFLIVREELGRLRNCIAMLVCPLGTHDHVSLRR